MPNRTRQCLLAVLCAVAQIHLALAHQAAPGAPDPWYGRNPKPKDFEAPRVPLGRFAIELPKDWQIVPGHAGIIFTAAEKTKNNEAAAAIVLEHMQLQSALEISPAVAEVELTTVKEREPSGQDFSQQIREGDGRRYILIQYTRPGFGVQENVVQYSMIVGSIVYRLICIVPAGQLPRYQPKFAHVAASFKPTT